MVIVQCVAKKKAAIFVDGDNDGTSTVSTCLDSCALHAPQVVAIEDHLAMI